MLLVELLTNSMLEEIQSEKISISPPKVSMSNKSQTKSRGLALQDQNIEADTIFQRRTMIYRKADQGYLWSLSCKGLYFNWKFVIEAKRDQPKKQSPLLVMPVISSTQVCEQHFLFGQREHQYFK